jgi:hypothetical protein
MMALGIIGGALAASQELSDGAKFRDQSHLVNPADDVAAGVAREFGKRHDARISPTSVGLDADGKVLPASNAAWLVSATTTLWGVTNRGFTGHYDVMYMARIEIRDLKNKHVVAKGSCYHGGQTSKGGASVDLATVTGDGPDGAKARFERVAQECVDTFVKEHVDAQPAQADGRASTGPSPAG